MTTVITMKKKIKSWGGGGGGRGVYSRWKFCGWELPRESPAKGKFDGSEFSGCAFPDIKRKE